MMKGKRAKRRVAAILCAAMLFTQFAPVLADDVVSIVPENVQTQEQSVSQFGLKAYFTDDVLCITVTGASQQPVVVKLYDESGSVVSSQTVSQGVGTVYFSGLVSGTYRAKAVYADADAQAQVEAVSITETILTQADAERIAQEKAAEEAAAKAEAEKKAAEEAAAKAEAEKKTTEDAAAQQQSGGVETIVPVQKTVESITPSQSDDSKETGTADDNGTTGGTGTQNDTDSGAPEEIRLDVSASASGSTVTVVLSGNKGENVDVVLYNAETEEEAGTKADVSDTATVIFTDIAAGEYIVNAWYRAGGAYGEDEVRVSGSADSDADDGTNAGSGADQSGDADTQPDTGTQSGGQEAGGAGSSSGSLVESITPPSSGTQTPTEPTQPDAPTPTGEYSIEVETGKGTLSVTVKDALAQAMYVEITKPDGSTQAKTIETGSGMASFTGLAAGVYSVYLDYVTAVSGVSPVTQEGIVLTEGADVVPVISGQFAVDAGVGGTTVTVTVSEAKEQPVDVVLIRPDKTTDVRQLSAGNGTIRFENLADGSYSVVVAYQSEVQGISSVKRDGLVVASAPVAASAIVATASAGENRVDVSVTSASQLPVAVTLLKGGVIQGTQRIEAGVGAVSFTALSAGTYSVSVDYAPSQQSVRPYQIDNLVVTDRATGIVITGVTAGENRLKVAGAAQPGMDVTLTTEPAIPAAIVRTGADGKFSAELICSAGTYTAVHAQYGADSASRATIRGTFVVTAPAVKPPITVNPIYEKDSTVTARSTPGTIVNIGIYDYGQTLVADERGMLQFSLPHWYVNGTKVTFTVYYGNGKEFSYQYEVTVGYQKVYTQLRRGSKGQEVYNLTMRLKDLGYLSKAQTGYDDTVVAAVKHFQANNGLAVDGIAGQLTQTALWSVAAIGAYESGFYPTLVRGDRGMALIYTLQQRLKDLGYYTIRVDGIYGSGTQRAVRDFQYVNGLAVTGKADHTTQTLLYSASAKPVGSVSASGYTTLSRSGRYDARVVPLQRRLKALGYYAGSVDGYFGSKTYRAVRNFQYKNGISVTGIADAYTQQVLYSAAAKTYSGGVSGTTSSAGYRLLYWGCKGDDVKRLQRALLSAGYTQVRSADGIYGQWTYDAVCAFQKANGLTVDGVAGKNTQNKLYGTSY